MQALRRRPEEAKTLENKRDNSTEPMPVPETKAAEPADVTSAAEAATAPAAKKAVKPASPAKKPAKTSEKAASPAKKPAKASAKSSSDEKKPAKPSKKAEDAAKKPGKAKKPVKAVKPKKKRAKKAAKKLTPAEKARIKERKRKWALARKIIGRFFLFIFVLAASLFIGLYAVLNEVFHGPSQTAADKLAMTLFETSAAKWVPGLYYTEEELEALRERNKTVELSEPTDVNLIVFNPPSEEEYNTGEEDGPKVEDGIILEEIHGATYHGWMMTVLDPSRVSLGVSADWFDEYRPGMRIEAIAEKYGAVAAINGGSFNDSGGQGNGGVPNGVTVSQGTVMNAFGGGELVTAAFNENNVLIVGKMTRDWARDNNIRDACSFGPALVINGIGAEFKGGGSGLNPRTAIGQRADGAVLMLVIDGRQVNSMGATYSDLVEIMLRYGAVNACNLDGGSSSNLYYKGELVNDGVAITGARRIPTAFVVR